MTFEEYLITKKINATLFKQAEPQLYQSWLLEFEQVHPNSFTAQKLYLINPIRRKYILIQESVKSKPEINTTTNAHPVVLKENTITTYSESKIVSEAPDAKPEVYINPVSTTAKPARPVFKPKPKID